MSHKQKIGCSVAKCAHNCIDDSTCRLDEIKVCPCRNEGSGEPDDDTACGSYNYVGDLNVTEVVGRD